MISATLIVDSRRKTKKGYPIKIRIYNGELHKYLPLGLYQQEKDLKTNVIIKQREYLIIQQLDYINQNDLSIESAFEVFKNGVPDEKIQKIMILEAELKKLKKQDQQTMLFDFAEKFLSEKKSREEVTDQHTSSLNKFKLFIAPLEDIPINDLSYELLNSFQSFLISDVGSFSVRNYMSKLHNIYIESQKRETLMVKSSDPFKLIKKVTVIRDLDKSIPVDVLKKLLNVDFSNLKKYKTNDFEITVGFILFQFSIGGHDMIDVALLKWKDIKDGRLVFRRHKNRRNANGGPLISNLLTPYALEFIEKYGTKTEDRIFAFISEPRYGSEKFNSYTYGMNRRLKQLVAILGVEVEIKTKRPRYTFRTIAGNMLINEMIIKKLMGHSDNSVSMGYQGAIPYSVQDAEHLKVIQYVFGE